MLVVTKAHPPLSVIKIDFNVDTNAFEYGDISFYVGAFGTKFILSNTVSITIVITEHLYIKLSKS